MNSKKKLFSARNIATFGVLVALMVVLQLFASAIPMFGVTLNFSLIPIVLGAICFGSIGGGLMGFISGVITFITCAVMGREPFTLFLFQANPVMLTIVCIGKTTFAGVLSGLAYFFVSKKSKIAAGYVAAILLPIVNTGLYLVGLIAMKGDVAEYLGVEASAGAVFIAVFVIIWLNFILEIVVNALFAPAIATVARSVERKIR